MKKAALLAVVLSAALLLGGCGASAGSISSASAFSNSAADSSGAASGAPAAVSGGGAGVASALNIPQPIYGNQIRDGAYSIEVKSSSSMFRILGCLLTVENGEMSAAVTLSGTGYEKLYMGKGKAAEADSDEAFSYFVEDAEGAYTYKVPVEALDMDIDCAAFSIRKQTWYDRVLVFQSDLIPADAIANY